MLNPQPGNSESEAGEADGLEPDGLEKAKVLVVDDRPQNLLVTKTVLDELGHDVITAASGEEALRRILYDDFAVILLDVNMPGMDGLETAGFIRNRRRTAHTPIIFLTAYVEEMHTAKGYSLGAVDYILTPVLPDILRTKVSVFVQLDLMRRQVRRQADQRIALAREQAARAVAEAAEQRSALLADAGAILSKSLDVDTTLKTLAPFVAQTLGDFCVLALTGDNGNTAQAEIAWKNTAEDGAIRTESAAQLFEPALVQAIEDAQGAGAPCVVAGMAKCLASVRIARADMGEAVLPLGCGLHSLLALPMAARGRRLGTMILGLSAAGREFDAGAQALARDLAARAAISLDNCLLYAKIQAEDQRKNEFLAMLAHELRNPLAPIRSAVQILRLPQLAGEKFDWARDIIDRQTQHLVRLVDDLLDVARITRGSISLKIEPVDVARVMKVAEEMSRPLIDARSHELVVTPPGEPLTVHGDHARIAQILANLLNNAAKYTDPGGRIALSVAEDGANVLFRIGDSGIGMPRHMLDSIFELFTQADHSLDRSQGGLGIGLTIVRRLVEMQNGSVQAFSAGPGKGSEFTVRLPRAAPTPATQANSRKPARNGHSRRVLVVDDYLDAADSMAALLLTEGQEVSTAHDGYQAIELARRLRPSIVFLDIGLPGISGFEVARVLRQTPETRDCVLIALSGYGQAKDMRMSAEAGFDRHLIKPVELSHLREVFDSLEKGHA